MGDEICKTIEGKSEGGNGMNNAKVTVTKEVAEALEELREEGMSDFNIMRQAHEAVVNPTYLTIQRWAFIGTGGGTPGLLMQALVNGYTVEKTPEDIIKEKYEELSDYEPIDRACKDSFRFVLDKLGIKIEGVNA